MPDSKTTSIRLVGSENIKFWNEMDRGDRTLFINFFISELRQRFNNPKTKAELYGKAKVGELELKDVIRKKA